MDMTKYPADVLGLIFAQLDLKGMVSLALTCRRLLTLFSTYSASTLFPEPWTFEYKHNLRVFVGYDRPDGCYRDLEGSLIYQGPYPYKFHQEFDATQKTKRLRYIFDFTKQRATSYLRHASASIDYYVIGTNGAGHPRRYHVFKLAFEHCQMMYTQYRRTGKAMFASTFEGGHMISCHFFNKKEVSVFSAYKRVNSYLLRSHPINGRVKEWTCNYFLHDLRSEMGKRFPLAKDYPDVIRIDVLALLYSKRVTLEYITSNCIRKQGIAELYVR